MHTTGCGGKFHMETAVLLLVAACLSGCGGGSVAAPYSPPSPPVTVTIVGPSGTLNTGSSFTLTATMHNS
jgi:hypothetical protein